MADDLQPSIACEYIYPEETVFMPRTSVEKLQLLGFNALNLDTITSHLMGVLNGRSTIRHEAGAGEEVLDLFKRAGIAVKEDLHTFSTGREAHAVAQQLICKGKRLTGPYPLPDGMYPDDAFLVPPNLTLSLNAKCDLDKIVPSQYLPARKTLRHEELAALDITEPIILKAGGYEATGAAFTVKPCRDKRSLNEARRWFLEKQDLVPTVIVEEWVETTRSWGVGIIISDLGVRCCSGAEQVLQSITEQVASVIAPDNILPEDAIQLAISIGEAACKLGYRGIAGLDIGQRTDGRLIVFDPNFRFTTSTTQQLYHESVINRGDYAVTYSCEFMCELPFLKLSERLHAPLGEGWFIPTRIFNGEKHPLANGKHIVTGFVAAQDRNQAKIIIEKLRNHVCG